jgi:hypothetical protein
VSVFSQSTLFEVSNGAEIPIRSNSGENDLNYVVSLHFNLPAGTLLRKVSSCEQFRLLL